MTDTPNRISPQQFAAALIQAKADEVRELVEQHVRNRSADDLPNSQVRVLLERTRELLREAAQRLLEDDDGP